MTGVGVRGAAAGLPGTPALRTVKAAGPAASRRGTVKRTWFTTFNKSDVATVAHPPGEPTPVYEDGAPGDAATVRYFIARQPTGRKGPGALAIGLYKLSWLPPQ